MNATPTGKSAQNSPLISRDFSSEVMYELHACVALSDAVCAQVERFRDCFSPEPESEEPYLTRITYVMHELIEKLNKLNDRIDSAAVAGILERVAA